jgi:hypothetical protein
MILERVPCGYYKFVNKKARGLYEKGCYISATHATISCCDKHL